MQAPCEFVRTCYLLIMTNTEQTGRGVGRYYYRIGVKKSLAVQYATTLYPELDGADVAAGWSAERKEVRMG